MVKENYMHQQKIKPIYKTFSKVFNVVFVVAVSSFGFETYKIRIQGFIFTVIKHAIKVLL